MGKVVAVVVAVLTVWGALAQIMPDVFQVHRDSRLMQFIWGPKSIWVAVLAIGCLVGFYIWNLEDRLSSLPAGTISSVTAADESGLRFVSWGPSPDGLGCVAAIDASRLPVGFKDNYEVALVCGFADPTVDRFKDTRISLSVLFTPQEVLNVSLPFSKNMADALANDQRAAISKLNPRPPTGTPIGVLNYIWFKIVLLPKGSDRSNIQKLSDVIAADGKIANAEAAVGVARNIPAP